MRRLPLIALAVIVILLAPSCTSSSGPSGNMGSNETIAGRASKIAAEPKGDFYYGRRYYVKKTRFWGYLRRPGQNAKQGKLVIFNESQKRNPDRLPETGGSKNYGFDSNYQYQIYGRFTGRTLYDPNSNQKIPEFLLTDYKLVDKDPGWLFSPSDQYSDTRITLGPR